MGATEQMTVLIPRSAAISRLKMLAAGDHRLPHTQLPTVARAATARGGEAQSVIQTMLKQAGLRFSPTLLLAASLSCALICGGLSASFFPRLFMPLSAFAGALLPFSWLESKIRRRSMSFAADYPAALLAAAASIKAGMTPQLALARSVKLLAATSLVRLEVKKLTDALEQGLPKAQALKAFGTDIRQPDLALFRSAFLLVMENGGKFAPTLERLALVCRQREILISSAMVSTSSMRMTANILLGIIPLIIFAMSARITGYWDILLHDQTANGLASTGLIIIAGSYALLRHLSNFKP